ncbi:class I SAM-dependent methyltransferase [Candidatus Woesearchaeota archaeon]|nr:class I SAM-dependent methyltransferase [Candidatus Woesearchaeota archaeon]
MFQLKKEIDKRRKLIYPYIRDKQVLDLGPGDIRYRFLHEFIAKSSKAMGLEIDEDRAKELKKKGYNIFIGDAQNFDLKKKFDVIAAGDLIEHLTNFEGFFKSVKKNLKKEGIIILNTPNVFSLYNLIGISRRAFEEHSCWFDERTLKQLIKRYNFRIIKIFYYTNDYGTLKGKIMQLVFKIKPKWNSNILIIAKKIE